MNKIRILGLISLVVGLIGIFFLERYDLEFLFGILAGAGIGWLLTGRFIVMNRK
ncbi:hypothetical protein BC962_1769 [Gillisia mitskevichiae]|uniref:Uncharacterized protein n=1 Tax=Gillisia mitskevichiae TaxID=270921 RepID=A0A495PTI9_9FLAO|nr:hypothetical protein [Gillisia mitskevichiae]RKS53517.1 hypothetical protein BC962_1769 [Gillisia mitskevichiae]